jgi:hypothetical protein
VTKPTKFMIHGFLDSTNTPWWIDMKNAILEVVRIEYREKLIAKYLNRYEF